MEFRRIFVLHGPNVWSREPAVEAWVDLAPLAPASLEQARSAHERLREQFPALDAPKPSGDAEEAIVDSLRQAVRELHRLADAPSAFAEVVRTADERLWRLAVGCPEETATRECLEAARRWVLTVWHGEPFDLDGEVTRLRDRADRLLLGPSTLSVVNAARERGIPVRRLNTGSLVQLGHGARQRRIWTAETDRTSAIAERIASDKFLSKRLLQSVGVPVPEGRVVVSPADAWQAACEIGGAVVVKPLDANHGRAVFPDLKDRGQIEAAYNAAVYEGSGVLVERFARGVEHRLLVVGDWLVAAAGGDPIYVEGDGRQTVEQLVQSQVNSDPRRGEFEHQPLNTIEFDAVVLSELARQGHSRDSVPQPGEKVLIRRNDNLTTDVTDHVHPRTARQAVLAARTVGLNVAGLDVVAEDISRPLEEQGGAFVEVNAGPGLLMHLKPAVGRPRPVGEAILSTMFGPGETGRIPIVVVAESPHASDVIRAVAELLRPTYGIVGVVDGAAWQIGEERLSRSGGVPRAARDLLLHPDVAAAIFRISDRDVLEHGLPFDECHVAILPPPAAVGDTVAREVLLRSVSRDGTAVLYEGDLGVIRKATDKLLPAGDAR